MKTVSKITLTITLLAVVLAAISTFVIAQGPELTYKTFIPVSHNDPSNKEIRPIKPLQPPVSPLPTPAPTNDCPPGTEYNLFRDVCVTSMHRAAIYVWSEYGVRMSWPVTSSNGNHYIYTMVNPEFYLKPNNPNEGYYDCQKKHDFTQVAELSAFFPEVQVYVENDKYQFDLTNDIIKAHFGKDKTTVVCLIVTTEPIPSDFKSDIGVWMSIYTMNDFD